MPLIMGILAQSAAAPAAAGAYDLLETIELATPAAGAVFTNLNSTYASTYKHLQVRMVGRTERADVSDSIFLEINNDSGSNYALHYLEGTGSTVVSGASTSRTNLALGEVEAANSTAGAYGAAIIDILDAFSTSKNTTIRTFNGRNESRILFRSGLYISTSAVDELDFFLGASRNYLAGSRFSLYGIR